MNVKKWLASILSGLLTIGSVSYNPHNNTIVPSTVSYAESTNDIEIWDGKADTSWYDDQETEFHIYNAQQLAGIASLTNTSRKDFKDKTIYIENDIFFNDFNDKSNDWEPIAKGISFQGKIDGQNHNLFNYYSSSSGLISSSNGEICNLKFIKAEIISNSKTGIGGICSSSSGTIYNCYYNGRITSQCSLGGICCSSKGTIYGCVFYGDIKLQISNGLIGGICGYSYSTIENCHTYGSIELDAGDSGYDYSVGGICGRNMSIIEKCSNKANISAKNKRASISNSVHQSVGGICGDIKESAVIKDSYNAGSLYNKNVSKYLGGIFGYKYDDRSIALISNAFNTGKIITAEAISGGIANSNANIKFDNVYYLNTSSTRGFYNSIDPNGVFAKSEKNMKSEEFSTLLGEAYMYKLDNYPILINEIENERLKFKTPSLLFNDFDLTSNLELWEEYSGDISWLSSDPNVAIVDNNGVVTPKNNGIAIVYAMYNDEKAICDVIVNSYNLEDTSISIDMGSSKRINILSNNKIISPSKAIFKTSSDAIAKVDVEGNVTAIKEGSCSIIVSIGGNDYICNVTVNPVVITTTATPSIELDKPVLSIQGGTQTSIKVLNYNGSITWVSSDTKIATVAKNSDNTATIKGISKGMTTVYAMLSNGKNLVCNVTVTNDQTTTITTKLTTTTKKTTTTTKATTSTTRKTTTTTKKTTTTTKKTTTTTTKVTTTTMPISIGKTEVSLKNGGQYTIPANRNDLSYKSNNNDVAIVSSKGIITAVGTGKAVISVIDSEWNVVQINVTVTSSATQVLPGDSNMDNTVDLSDAVLIMQSLANPNKYGLNGTDKSHLTEQGHANADVEGKNGVTANDALAIQKYLLNLIPSLPV